jgi:hypothetical protein
LQYPAEPARRCLTADACTLRRWASMEHELSPTLAPPASAEFEGTPPEQPGVEHGSSIEEQLADAKARTQQWQVKRVVNEATKPFPIDVTDLTGATIKVEASLDTSVDALRALVHEQTGVDPDLQMLLVDNEIPMEDETLALGAYGLRRGLRIQLTPQDPTKAATRRRLRHEGRKAAEQRAEAAEARQRRREKRLKMVLYPLAFLGAVAALVFLLLYLGGVFEEDLFCIHGQMSDEKVRATLSPLDHKTRNIPR